MKYFYRSATLPHPILCIFFFFFFCHTYIYPFIIICSFHIHAHTYLLTFNSLPASPTIIYITSHIAVSQYLVLTHWPLPVCYLQSYYLNTFFPFPRHMTFSVLAHSWIPILLSHMHCILHRSPLSCTTTSTRLFETIAFHFYLSYNNLLNQLYDTNLLRSRSNCISCVLYPIFWKVCSQHPSYDLTTQSKNLFTNQFTLIGCSLMHEPKYRSSLIVFPGTVFPRHLWTFKSRFFWARAQNQKKFNILSFFPPQVVQTCLSQLFSIMVVRFIPSRLFVSVWPISNITLTSESQFWSDIAVIAFAIIALVVSVKETKEIDSAEVWYFC